MPSSGCGAKCAGGGLRVASLASQIAPTAAMPAAPARLTASALAAVIPPTPITGTPRGASRASAANPVGPSGGPASGLCPVAKQGPTLQ